MQPHEDEAEVAPGQSVAEPASSPPAGQDRRANGAEGRSAAADARRDARPDARAAGLRAAVLAFARSRLSPLSVDDAAAIAALCDEDALTELVDTLAQAASVDAARAVLDAALAGTRT